MTTVEKAGVRELVLCAFHELLVERGYIDLTVQDILKRAGVGRTAFYSHFSGKEDVLRNSMGQLRRWLVSVVEEAGLSNTPLAFSLPYFQHIISHHEIYDHIVGREEFYIFERYFMRMLAELILSQIRPTHYSPAQEVRLELIAQHIAGAIWATSSLWLERKHLSAEEMNESFRAMVLPGLEQSLKNI